MKIFIGQYSDQRVQSFNERRESNKLFFYKNKYFIKDYIDDLKDSLFLLEKTVEKYQYFTSDRNTDDIIQELNQLVNKLWYEQHQFNKAMIECGEDTCDPETWAEDQKTAEGIEQELGNNFACKSDYELGILAGKIFALNWVLGDEWVTLDS